MLTRLYTLDYHELEDTIEINITHNITQSFLVKEIIHRHHPDDKQVCVYGVILESITID